MPKAVPPLRPEMVPVLVLVTVSPGAAPLSNKPKAPPVRNMELVQVWLVPVVVHCCANAGAPGHSTAAISAEDASSAVRNVAPDTRHVVRAERPRSCIRLRMAAELAVEFGALRQPSTVLRTVPMNAPAPSRRASAAARATRAIIRGR